MTNTTVSLTKEELINILDKYLFGWEYKQIEKAAIIGDAHLAGFILGACFIDAMAGFYDGVTKDSVKSGSSARFRNFVKVYLKKYDAEKLWSDLRCGLVHSYTEGGTYIFTHANNGGFHFDSTPDGRIVLNFEDFLSDLREAYKNLRNDIMQNNEIFLRARKRYVSLGLMQELVE